MNLGLFVIHPLSVPFGYELTNTLVSVFVHGVTMYNGFISPEIQELKQIIKLL